MLDATIAWHERDERQRERDANKRVPSYAGNTLVRGGKQSNDFLAINLSPSEADQPYTVSLYRYTVPCRCDTYSFQLTHERVRRVRFYQDYGNGLVAALKLAAKDFDRPRVVAMIEEALNASRILSLYGRDLVELLRHVAPKSKSDKLARRMYVALEARRHAAFDARRAARATLRATGATDEQIEKTLGAVQPVV